MIRCSDRLVWKIVASNGSYRLKCHYNKASSSWLYPCLAIIIISIIQLWSFNCQLLPFLLFTRGLLSRFKPRPRGQWMEVFCYHSIHFRWMDIKYAEEKLTVTVVYKVINILTQESITTTYMKWWHYIIHCFIIDLLSVPSKWWRTSC